MFLLSGCASTGEHYQNRPLFRLKEETATHGRKSWFDRIIETDPGLTDYNIAADYQEHPPLRI